MNEPKDKARILANRKQKQQQKVSPSKKKAKAAPSNVPPSDARKKQPSTPRKRSPSPSPSRQKPVSRPQVQLKNIVPTRLTDRQKHVGARVQGVAPRDVKLYVMQSLSGHRHSPFQSIGHLLQVLTNIFRKQYMMNESEVRSHISSLLNTMTDVQWKKLLPQHAGTLRARYAEAHFIKELQDAYSMYVDVPLQEMTQIVPNLDQQTLDNAKLHIIRVTHTDAASTLNALVTAILRISEFYEVPPELSRTKFLLQGVHADSSTGIHSRMLVEDVRNAILQNWSESALVLYPLSEPMEAGVYAPADVEYLVTKYLEKPATRNKSFIKGYVNRSPQRRRPYTGWSRGFRNVPYRYGSRRRRRY